MIKRQWQIIDVKDKILGRSATQISFWLIGKHKPDYSPNVDSGDYVVVVNSDFVRVTGKKEQNKYYYRHSLYPGGFKAVSLQEQRKKDSRQLIIRAVSRMLPKNKLRDPRLKRLKVFSGSEHPYGKK